MPVFSFCCFQTEDLLFLPVAEHAVESRLASVPTVAVELSGHSNAIFFKKSFKLLVICRPTAGINLLLFLEGILPVFRRKKLFSWFLSTVFFFPSGFWVYFFYTRNILLKMASITIYCYDPDFDYSEEREYD